MTEKFRNQRLEIELPEAGQDEAPGQAAEALHTEIAELRASRARLVSAADEDRRRIERELHGGVQQHLVALAVRLQLASSALESDPTAAKALIEELSGDVQDAIDAAARLAQRIYGPRLELGLAAALRSAAVSAGVSASVAVSAGSHHPPEVLHTVYVCWLDALAHAGDTTPTITVREEEGALAFEIVRDGPAVGLDGLRDRVEALGGRMTTKEEAGGRIRVAGSLSGARRR